MRQLQPVEAGHAQGLQRALYSGVLQKSDFGGGFRGERLGQQFADALRPSFKQSLLLGRQRWRFGRERLGFRGEAARAAASGGSRGASDHHAGDGDGDRGTKPTDGRAQRWRHHSGIGAGAGGSTPV